MEQLVSDMPSVCDEEGWEQARLRVEQLFQAAHLRSSAAPRSILLSEPSRSVGHDQFSTALRSFVQAQQGYLLELSCFQPGLISFWAVQRLLDELAPIVAREAPDLLHRYGAELKAIHPSLAQALGINPALTLDQIALTPSERRSHRESEQAFRIINGLCALVIAAQQACPSLAGAPLVLWWKHLHEADRPSLLTFRRLSRWINHAQVPIVLIGSLYSDAQPTFDDPALPADIQHYFDWRGAHRQLLETVRCQLLGEELVIRDQEPALVVQPTSALIAEPPAGELNGSQAMLLALAKFQQGLIEEGSAYALHAMRLAVFALNVEAIILLGQQILAHLATLDDQHFATERFTALWHDLNTHDHYAALEFATAGIQQRQDIIMAAWKATALAQTFIGQHQTALECYEQALALAEQPAMRAQLNMYLGLLTGKRLRNGQRAREYLQQGFDQIEGLDDTDAGLERGWLFNVSGLMTYQAGQYREAMAMVRNALATMKPLHHGAATYLKINLVSNMSVLLEDTKQAEQALEIWSFFRTFLNTASESFAKHYFFREGGLRQRMGDHEGALECYRQSYEQAQAGDDGFHMEIVARACGYAGYQLGRFEEARGWFEQSAILRQQIGDYENLPEPLSAQALSLYRLNQHEAAQELLTQAEQLCLDLRLGCLAQVRHAQQVLEQQDSQALAEWERNALQVPNTKLNRPFYLINTYRGT